MKNKLLVISILLIIIIIVSYYWLHKRESLIETYFNTTTNVYIRNLNNNGTVNPILNATNTMKTMHIQTFNGHNVNIYIGEGIEEINGFFNQKSLSDMEKNILNVYFPSTLKKIGMNEFKGYSKLSKIELPSTIQEIGPNAFHGTAITSVNLPKNNNNFKRDLWNHKDTKDINSWLSYKPFVVKNIFTQYKSDEPFFKNKWTIVYNNKYYPIHDVDPTIKCNAMDLPTHENTRYYTSGDRHRGYKCGNKLAWGWNNAYDNEKCAKYARCCRCHQSQIAKAWFYRPNTGEKHGGSEIYKYNGSFVHTNDRLLGTVVDNNKIKGGKRYIVNNSFVKVNKNSITSDKIREIRKAYQNNKFPFEDKVTITYVTREGFEKQENTYPNTKHIETIEKYITDTENVQIATYLNVKDLHNIAGNNSSDGYLSVNKGQAYKDMKIINIVDGAVALGESLFENNSYVETIIIPPSVKYIKDKCFKSCTNLKRVLFYPVSQLISIGNNAFQGCTNLNTIHLPDSLQTIGYQAFQGCTNLRVYINPSSKLKVVAMDAFDATISKLILPAQTQFAPSPNKSITELINTGLSATTSVTNTINNAVASRYVSQTMLIQNYDSAKYEDSDEILYERKTIKSNTDNREYYFYYFHKPVISAREYNISFYSSKGLSSIPTKTLLVGGGGGGGGGDHYSSGNGGGGGGEVEVLNEYDLFSNDNITMKIGWGGNWNTPKKTDSDKGNPGRSAINGSPGGPTTLQINLDKKNKKSYTANPGNGGRYGLTFVGIHMEGNGGNSGSDKGGGTKLTKNVAGGGGGGGNNEKGKNPTNAGGDGGKGITWIDNLGYGGGGGGGGGWGSANGYRGNKGTAPGNATHGGGKGGQRGEAQDGRKGSGGGGGGGSRGGPHTAGGKWAKLGWAHGHGGHGSCVFAFKKSDFDSGGWKLQFVPIDYILGKDGRTVNGSSYNRQKTYDVYQNKTSNIVSIINNADNNEKVKHLFLTVPFPIHYYNTNRFSNDVLERQTQDIQRRISAIQKAEGIITTNIQIIREKIGQLPVTELIHGMNNAYGMNDLPSLTNFNAINSSINNYINEVESQFINVIIETNKEIFQLELATLEDDRDELQRQINDALATNTARIEKRLQREADLAGSDIQRKQEINKLKQSAGKEAEADTQTWYNQYKINYNLDELDNTITNKDDSIKLYHQNVKDSTTLNLLDNSLNNLDEVYNRVNDQNMSTEIKRNMLDLELKNIGKETAAREKELQKLQEEDIKLKEETKQIKNRLKLRKLDEIISNNNMDLKHVNNTIKQQGLFTDNVKDLVQDKKNKSNILGHAYTIGDNIIQSQQQLIDDNIKTQEKYQIEKFTNLNKYNMKYMDPKYEDYRLNQEDCDQLLDEFNYDNYCKGPYYNINKDKCIAKEICENRNNNNELENEMYINPGTRKRFKDNKDNYHYNYTNTMNMSLGILTLFTIIYKIK